MDVGSLFFKLGFQTDGLGAATQFNQTTEVLEKNLGQLLTIMNSMADSLNDLALKFGAINEQEHKLNRQTRDFGNTQKRLGEQQNQNNERGSKWQKVLKNLSGGLKEVISFLNPMTLAATIAASAVAKLALNAANIGGSLKMFSNLTGMSTDRVQILERKFAQFGVSAEEVQDTLKGLIETSNKIRLGDETSVRAYAVLGLTADMDPEEKMKRIAAAASRFKDKSMFAMFAKEAGLSEKVINGLVQGAMDVKVDQNAIMSPESVERAAKFERSWEEAKQSMADFASKIGSILIPMLEPFVSMIDNIVTGWRMVAGLVTDLEDQFAGFTDILKIIGIAIGTYLFGPVVAVLAVINDIVNFLRGKDSIIGDIASALGMSPEDMPSASVGANMKPAGSRGSYGNTSMNDNRTNNYQFEINGASDPQETARQIKRMQESDHANAYFSTFAGAQ